MSILKNILLAFLALVAVLVVVGFFLPSTAHVERSITVDAPAAVVYASVSNFKRFNEWSPWATRDPKTQYTFEGAEQGVGSKMSWKSEQADVGSGSQEIVEAVENKSVAMKLVFEDQQAASSFMLDETDGKTKVTWGFDADFGSNIIGRYMGLMMDDMLGPDYEKGLSNLKVVAEKAAQETPTEEMEDIQDESMEDGADGDMSEDTDGEVSDVDVDTEGEG